MKLECNPVCEKMYFPVPAVWCGVRCSAGKEEKVVGGKWEEGSRLGIIPQVEPVEGGVRLVYSNPGSSHFH